MLQSVSCCLRAHTHSAHRQPTQPVASGSIHTHSSTKTRLWGLSGTRGERSRDCDPTDPHPLYLLVHSRVSTRICRWIWVHLGTFKSCRRELLGGSKRPSAPSQQANLKKILDFQNCKQFLIPLFTKLRLPSKMYSNLESVTITKCNIYYTTVFRNVSKLNQYYELMWYLTYFPVGRL